jgi:hypothetical protein
MDVLLSGAIGLATAVIAATIGIFWERGILAGNSVQGLPF